MNSQNIDEQWFFMYRQLLEYKTKHGDCWVPRSFAENPHLGGWVNFQRCLYDTNRLPMAERTALNNIGFGCFPGEKYSWCDMFDRLKAYLTLHGHCNVPPDYDPKLSAWVHVQRQFPINGQCRAMLESIGFYAELPVTDNNHAPACPTDSDSLPQNIAMASLNDTAGCSVQQQLQGSQPAPTYQPRVESENLDGSASSPIRVDTSSPISGHDEPVASAVGTAATAPTSSLTQKAVHSEEDPAKFDTEEANSAPTSSPAPKAVHEEEECAKRGAENASAPIGSIVPKAAHSQEQAKCGTEDAVGAIDQSKTLDDKASILPDESQSSATSAASGSRLQQQGDSRTERLHDAVPLTNSLSLSNGHQDERFMKSTPLKQETSTDIGTSGPLPNCCCVCQDELKPESGQQVYRFGGTKLFAKDVSVHVFCGLTASMYPDKAQYEICSAKRIRKKFSTSHPDCILERAMKFTRKGTTDSTDNTGAKEVFYLVKEFHASLLLIKKHFSDICSQTKGGETVGDELDSKALAQLDKELEKLFGAHMKMALARDGNESSKKPSISGKGTYDDEQAQESARTNVAQINHDEPKTPSHVASQPTSLVCKIPSTAPRSSSKVGQYLTFQVDTRQDFGVMIDSKTHIVTSVHEGKQANQAGITVGSRMVSINGNRIKRRPIAALWHEAQEKGPTAEIVLQPDCKLYIEDSSSDESISDEHVPLDGAVIDKSYDNKCLESSPKTVPDFDIPKQKKSNSMRAEIGKRMRDSEGSRNSADDCPLDHNSRLPRGSGNVYESREKVKHVSKNLQRKKEVGSRVYSRYKNGEYYWGTITKKFRRNGSYQFHYSVVFDDGDLMEDVESQHVYTMQMYRDTYGTEPPPYQNHKTKKRANGLDNAVGSRVCCSIDDGSQACGTITNKFSAGTSNSYSVKLDDGTILIDVEDREFITAEQYTVSETGAVPSKQPQRRILRRKKKRKIGPSEIDEGSPHALVGKGFCQAWTDVKGRNKVVYGVITAYDEDPDNEEDARVTVAYNEESRSAANSMDSDSDSMGVPHCRTMKLAVACGGCLLYNQQVNGISKGANRLLCEEKSLLCWTWITPDMRTEELVHMDEGVRLPRLTCVVRGFLLTFSVKKSTIPNAGYGVFVKATRVGTGGDGKDKDLVLRDGEFLDLGLYAPFCSTDKRVERVFFVKSYIHSFKCEEWCFNTEDDDYLFDITDDVSGEAHDIARGHLPIYFNECSKDEVPWVIAEHDPEGGVHYLMGVTGESSLKKLVVPADGSEKEIFVNYGPDYEPVRLRKGYSELPREVKEKKLREMEREEGRYLIEIEAFSADEIAACVDFFLEMFSPEKIMTVKERLSRSAGGRALHVLRIFKKRIESLIICLGEEGPELVALSDAIWSLISRLEPLF